MCLRVLTFSLLSFEFLCFFALFFDACMMRKFSSESVFCLFLLFSLFLMKISLHSFFYKGEMVTDLLSVALSENDFVRYVAAASSI